MKYVLLAIFVLFAAQPVQGLECDMHDDQNTEHSQHSNMHDDPVDSGHGQDMDCCDDEAPDIGDSCGSMSHCGTCVAGLPAVNSNVFKTTFGLDSQQYSSAADTPLSRFTSPPYRPPIA